ncbi:hypothetical protein ACFFX0_13325 [Citricoccus parietis]|uniref:Uncharacterized protein n=1 Tax=Citricoccus parietis TaxID=592307 RepID=A0ABV5FZQ5_9MICC
MAWSGDHSDESYTPPTAPRKGPSHSAIPAVEAVTLRARGRGPCPRAGGPPPKPPP